MKTGGHGAKRGGPMENEYGADLREIFQVIDSAEVLVVRFAVIERRLLIDARTSPEEGPLIQMVPPVSSAEERFQYLRQIRPSLRLPERIFTFMWPRQVAGLQASGVWGRIVERMVKAGGPAMEEHCRAVLEELAAEERAQMVAAVRGGPGFKSLWERRE